ncbi:xylulokinase [Listeria floridensis FSL S10-1187]|uniref:Xylulose kinase n=1 Tax=Listeria floridensis FSL S10-1187 TaxID=1265817 RepID=A0ABP3AYK1_9LIST|nr:xylulokinase [Listeria floridensis]EUJ32287.1 xylulokinase [Listeria floridensis FSL S10-1187]
MTYFIGVDLGTSSLKMIAATEEGEILATASSSFSIISEQVGFSEENPADWLTAFDLAFIELIEKFPPLTDGLAAISFSGQMHSLVMLDQSGRPLRNAILWNDTRTATEVKELTAEFGKHLLGVEKNRALEGFTLPKILWVKKHQPELWEKTWKFMLPKDYLIYYLTGQVFTDRTDASGTIMYDIKRHEWDRTLLDQLKIDVTKCPDILRSTDSAGKLKPALQEKFGIKSDVAVIMGGADNACGALGNISDPSGQALISVGTSGVVLAYAKDVYEVTGKYHCFNSALPEMDYKMGVTLSAGYSLDWLKKLVAPSETFQELTSEVGDVPIGSDGITFNPYLFGERSPYFNPHLSASFSGLRAHHTRRELVRAVLEGVACSLRNVYEEMELDKGFRVFRITGGVVKNRDWLQMFADIFNAEMEVLELDEGPAFGALLCAIQSVTGVKPGEVLAKSNVLRDTFIPIAENVEDYQQVYQRFLIVSQINDQLNREKG